MAEVNHHKPVYKTLAELFGADRALDLIAAAPEGCSTLEGFKELLEAEYRNSGKLQAEYSSLEAFMAGVRLVYKEHLRKESWSGVPHG